MHSQRGDLRIPRLCAGPAILLLVALAGHGWAQEAGLRAASGGVAGRLVVLPSKGSGLYSWALPVTLGGLLKQAQVEAASAEVLAALLREKKPAGAAGGLPPEWAPDALQAAAQAGQVGKEQGYVLVASWNTAERSQEKWNDDTPFWLVAKLQRGPQVVFDTTRLPREESKCYRLADYDAAVRDLADMVVQNINPGALDQARRGELWQQRGTLEQVRCLAEAEQDIAAGRLEEARRKLTEAQVSRAGAEGSLAALQLLVEVNAALARQDPGRAGDIGRQAEEAGRALEAHGAKTQAWAGLSVAEGLRLQGKWPEAAAAYASWIQFLTDENLMQPEECFPEDARAELDARKPRVWERLTTPALEAQWWGTVGLSLYRGVSGALAQPVCAYADQRAAAEPDPAARAAALVTLADQARLRSDLDRALATYQQALAIQQQLAPDSLDCATVDNRMGTVYADRGDGDHALEWYLKAVAIRERLAPDTLDCAASYNNVGTVYSGRRDAERALEWYQKALAIRERLTPGSPGCAGTYNNIGALYRRLGDDERAVAQFERALAILEKETPGSRDCSVIYNNLGNVESDRGDMNRALEWYHKALAIRERLTPGSLEGAMVYNNVASTYANHGDYDHALEWHEKALPICERQAPGSTLCALSYSNIGQVYGHKGDFGVAVEWLHKALVIYEKLEPRSLDCGSTVSAIGFYLLNLDQTEKALPYLTRAVEIAPEDAGVQLNLAWGRVVLKQRDEAVAQLDRVCAHQQADLVGLATSKDEQLAKHLLAQENPGGYYLLWRVWEAAHEGEWAWGAYDRFHESARADRTWKWLDEQVRMKLPGGDK